MANQGSLALNMNEAEREPRESPELEVLLGGGLDARAREAASPRFVAVVRAVVVAAVLFLLLGIARVAITSATVTLLQDNSDVRTQISQMETSNDSLRIERSTLSSSARISAIATGTYGMVSATDTEQLELDASSAGMLD